MMTLSEQIRQVADKNGLKLTGIAPADAFSDFRWSQTLMRDPRLTIPDAKSLIIVCVCELNYLKEIRNRSFSGRFARSYASGHEYNLVDELVPLKELLVRSGYIAEISPATIETSTIPLKLAAARAGLGNTGNFTVLKHLLKYQKHSNPVIAETAIWSVNKITYKKRRSL